MLEGQIVGSGVGSARGSIEARFLELRGGARFGLAGLRVVGLVAILACGPSSLEIRVTGFFAQVFCVRSYFE